VLVLVLGKIGDSIGGAGVYVCTNFIIVLGGY
jgi:hypothetical protein